MRRPSRGVLDVAAAAACLCAAAAAPIVAKARSPKIVVVAMNNLAYEPETITARVGDKVAWINRDIFMHSATTPDFDVVLKPGASSGVALLKPGVINYICRFHPGMKGQIVVQK